MPIAYGRVAIKKLMNNKTEESEETGEDFTCYICHNSITKSDLMHCVNPKCNTPFHVICLGKNFTPNVDVIIPVEGECPSCKIQLLWGDLVRLKKGCYKNLIEDMSLENSIESMPPKNSTENAFHKNVAENASQNWSFLDSDSAL